MSRASSCHYPLTLFSLDAHPNRVAISDTGSFVTDGAFFLDFSRPLEKDRRFGLTVGVFVPVIHQGEARGGYVVGVGRGDPYYPDIRKLWKARYPAAQLAPAVEAEGFKIIADFATQFPNHCS